MNSGIIHRLLQLGNLSGCAAKVLENWRDPNPNDDAQVQAMGLWNRITSDAKVVLHNKKKLADSNVESNHKVITELARAMSKRKAAEPRR